jgi:hypothetical protein
MQSVDLTCGVQGSGCGKSFRWTYDELKTPFFQETRGTPWPGGKCPLGGEVFLYARRHRDPSEPGLVTVFD